MILHRKDYQYMELCFSIAEIFSTCGKKQYGAVLVDDRGHVLGIGYNGGPSGFVHCIDGGCPRLQQNSPSGSSYENCFSVHAEANVLLHSDYSAQATKLYVNGPPCFSCAKLIANSTVKSLYYIEDSNYQDWYNVLAFLNKAGVETNRMMKNASI